MPTPKTKPEYPKRDIIQEVNDQILAALAHGVKQWVAPFDPKKAHDPQLPFNPITGNAYRGTNSILLAMSPHVIRTGDPRFCGFDQARREGWMVRKGEKSTGIIYVPRKEVEDEKQPGESRVVQFAPVRQSVFHLSQIDGAPPYVPATLIEPLWNRPREVDAILQNSGIPVRVANKAAYNWKDDFFWMPPANAFLGPAEYAATALHEAVHATGHESRLNRQFGRPGTALYAQEELCAELGSAMLSRVLGIPADIPNHASYIAGYMTLLTADKSAFVKAASAAQKGVDKVLEWHRPAPATVAPGVDLRTTLAGPSLKPVAPRP